MNVGDCAGTDKEGVRRPICDMTLLIFHLVLSAFTFEGVDVHKAARILEWNLERYPNGALSSLSGTSRASDFFCLLSPPSYT